MSEAALAMRFSDIFNTLRGGLISGAMSEVLHAMRFSSASVGGLISLAMSEDVFVMTI